MMKEGCFLRKSMVRLMDGEEYAFRALPFTEASVGVLEMVMGGGVGGVGRMRGLLEGIRLSLSYDHGPEEVDDMLRRGLVPLSPGEDGSEETRVYEAVLGAMVLQLGGGSDSADGGVS